MPSHSPARRATHHHLSRQGPAETHPPGLEKASGRRPPVDPLHLPPKRKPHHRRPRRPPPATNLSPPGPTRFLWRTPPPAAASKEASVKNHCPSPPHGEAPAPISPCDHECANTQSHQIGRAHV